MPAPIPHPSSPPSRLTPIHNIHRTSITSSIIGETLVYIHASGRPNSVSRITGDTGAISRSVRIRADADAVGVGKAAAVVGQTFVDVNAAGHADSVARIPGVATALAGSGSVCADAIQITPVYTHCCCGYGR